MNKLRCTFNAIRLKLTEIASLSGLLNLYEVSGQPCYRFATILNPLRGISHADSRHLIGLRRRRYIIVKVQPRQCNFFPVGDQQNLPKNINLFIN